MTGLPPGFVLDGPGASATVAGSPQLPPGFALDTPSIAQGMTDTAGKYATFGLSNPVTAAGMAGVEKLAALAGYPGLYPGHDASQESFGDLYGQHMADLRGQSANFAAAHPILNAGAAVAGAATQAPALGVDALRSVVPASFP
jgi:hypothetical protein